ncbi:battenin [Toxorhynchites rutilus septentrionalis]|uniref:battenin n=1 Tax=Toxorhynchites rutilus septentrionalis TaxID=329112 RepID=UPI0024793C75|nr:battenin [Toxorhynchites rutilus septentrionalis]
MNDDSVTSAAALNESQPRDRGLWRDLVAYWILGLCNNYGYVVMLTAAHDILKDLDGSDHGKSLDEHSAFNSTLRATGDFVYDKRPCNKLSTGAILLADILPALSVKLIASFLPLWKHARVLLCVALAGAGFILVAFATKDWMLFLGVICTSFSSGLGEATFLAYASYFNKNVISTWSSGTGGAGVIGALSYTGLTAFGLSPKATMLVMLVVPSVEAGSFWLLLRHRDSSQNQSPLNAEKDDSQTDYSALPPEERPLETWRQKISFIPSLFIYMIPLVLVYLFEYFINQGLFELVYFPAISLSQSEQYRWYQVLYQIGVFISRSSVNIVHFKHVWIMAVLQFVNMVYFTFEAVYMFTPSIWIIFVLILWEGLLGGGGYVNTFYRMQIEIPEARREYAMMITSISDSVGIALAGVAAIPSHNAICDLPVPNRLM